ncbi:HvfA family oxazolone/thioamide-modified RiPP metallophore [Algiphilus aromaticivorans]|jgi:uncharacterized low-complexity protein|uniref:HvfA family oxazolone/thioamide-modified RiPP metallophore n=1 Tax=Algiphilus aromaticivorans TaxID=382454 RepID=UPI0005C1D91E|nr:hypothetical protein [Algiphilus aromaticivorans]
MSNKTHSRLSSFAATVGGAAFLASTAASAGVSFQSTELGSGYQNGSAPIELADAHGKSGEGKCGEGKCGESKGHDKGAEGKCGEGKCGESKGADKKSGEGKCGEGKCGS